TICGALLVTGKKNEIISLQRLDANVAERSPRQIFAKVPGVFVYDMDGTGNQINIATRGLDPHRGWEFNIRQNGVIVNSDLYGYPASHYALPMEAVSRIELVRGTGSLQYGAQFGGLLNYVTKQPDTTKAFNFESQNTAGSFGLLSTYNAVGGKVGKLQYYGYFSLRKNDGYRDNAGTDYDAQGVMLRYEATKNFVLKAEFSRSNYLYQIPGPLTDSMFAAQPTLATRSRNYFNPEIYVPSLSAEWRLNSNTRMQLLVSALLGNRNSVQFDRPANVPDAINPATGTYAQRQVDIDNFNSYTTEYRILHNYNLRNKTAILAAGFQYINNDLHRRQLGKGTTGTDYDLSIDSTGWGRDLHFKTQNIAFFAENTFNLTSRLSTGVGVRVENGGSKMSGIIRAVPPGNIPTEIEHQFPLFGLTAGYKINETQNLYAGWTQAYRPVLFKDIIPATPYDLVDPDMKDANGYNGELGYRGNHGGLQWDVNVFYLQYNDRPGSLTTERNDTVYILRTNIGDSYTYGLECYVEYGFALGHRTRLSAFTSTSVMEARYQNGALRTGQENTDISGNRVESAPTLISRNGITLRHREHSFSILYSYTGETYADALNTEKPSASGSVGLVPAYHLMDLNATLFLTNNLSCRLSVNNLFDTSYFTKRPQFYPGPGVWSSDGRSANVTLVVRL
ncbi:MAG: TonB-dependent receptor, partial [Saprospiraceae bacterium]|nr:TonB-dependent receptor [Saprospiraceae bacterium]